MHGRTGFTINWGVEANIVKASEDGMTRAPNNQHSLVNCTIFATQQYYLNRGKIGKWKKNVSIFQAFFNWALHNSHRNLLVLFLNVCILNREYTGHDYETTMFLFKSKCTLAVGVCLLLLLSNGQTHSVPFHFHWVPFQESYFVFFLNTLLLCMIKWFNFTWHFVPTIKTASNSYESKKNYWSNLSCFEPFPLIN